jgi:hypothetical protein
VLGSGNGKRCKLLIYQLRHYDECASSPEGRRFKSFAAINKETARHPVGRFRFRSSNDSALRRGSHRDSIRCARIKANGCHRPEADIHTRLKGTINLIFCPNLGTMRR